MSWSGQLYGKVFDRFGEFHLRENGTEDQHKVSSFSKLNSELLVASKNAMF
jgi:hypothetical protein